MHGHPRKPTKWCQGLIEAIVLLWCGVSYEGITFLYYCEKGIKRAVKNYQRDILTNVTEPLNQTMFQNRPWIF